MGSFASKHRLVVFYGITFLISWTAWGLMALLYDGEHTTIIIYAFSTLGGLGPLLSLSILQRVTHEEVSLKDILAQIKFKQQKAIWSAAAILAIPIFSILGTLIYFALGKADHLQIIKSGPDDLGFFVIPVMMIHFAASLVTSPLFEEPGWRGFAVPKLQARFGRTIGSLIVGGLWWIWHQPMNLTFGLEPSIYSAASMVVLSFIIDSLYNLSGRNLLAAMLTHQSYGTVFTFIFEAEQNWATLGLRIIFLLFLRWAEARQSNTALAVPAG